MCKNVSDVFKGCLECEVIAGEPTHGRVGGIKLVAMCGGVVFLKRVFEFLSGGVVNFGLCSDL